MTEERSNEPLPSANAADDGEPIGAVIKVPQVEGYRILGLLGEGDTGYVWRAIQEEGGRTVALKLLPRELFGSDDACARFERDATIAAQLNHPNIARLYEVTRSADVYCYAAELVEGLPVDEYVRAHQMSPAEILWLLWMIAEAVEHAHQRGLLHTNLKPANILIDDAGEPHVLDFALDKAWWTGVIPGPPTADRQPFLSPEAVAGPSPDLDSRTDVYSLGAILLWLLTGESSYDEATGRPRVVDSPDRELEALLRKALAEDREQRYASPGEFSQDIARYLQDEPLNVLPPTAGYILGKRLRQYRAELTLAVVVALVLVAWAVFSYLRTALDREAALTAARQATAERDQAARALRQARPASVIPGAPEAGQAPAAVEPTPARLTAQADQENYARLIGQADALIAAASFDQAEALLWSAPPARRQWEWGRLLALCHRDLWTFASHGDRDYAVAVSLNGKRLATGGNLTAKLWSLENGQELLTLTGHTAPVRSLAFSADGKRLLTGSRDDTVRLWDTATGRALWTWKIAGGVRAVTFLPDGSPLVATGEELTLHIGDVRTGREQGSARLGVRVSCLAFAADGRRLITGSTDGRAHIWEIAGGRQVWEFHGHSAAVTAVAFSPDGSQAVTAGAELTLRFWDTGSGRDLRVLRGHEQPVESLAFSPDGRRLLTASRDRTAKLWDLASGQELNTFRGHADVLTGAGFLPDGLCAVTASLDGTAKLWRAEKSRDILAAKDSAACARLLAGLTVTRGASVSLDGRRTLTARADQPVKVVEAETGRELLTLEPEVTCVRALGLSPVPRRIIAQACDNTLRLWDAADWTIPSRDEYAEQQRRQWLGSSRSR